MSTTWLQLASPARQNKTAQRSLSFTMPAVLFRCSCPKPRSTGCRWRIHWRNAPGRCCCCPEFLTQTASSKCRSTQGCRPVRGRGPQLASGGRGGTSCGSFGLPRSKRCSWGNHWRLAAIPPQTQSTPVRCYPRLLRGRKQGDWSGAIHGMTTTVNTRQQLLNERSGWPFFMNKGSQKR